jgi:hypothetical protein
MKLEIACGQRKQEGWTGIDYIKTAQCDIQHDLFKFPWPIEDNSVEEAQCSHFVEHIPMPCACSNGDADPLLRFFDELYRIMTDGAKCLIVCPYYSSVRAWQDPTHRRAISERTFLYTNKEWRKVNLLDHYKVSCDFDFTYGWALNADTAGRAQEAQPFWINHYVNAVDDIYVTLTKRPKKD